MSRYGLATQEQRKPHAARLLRAPAIGIRPPLRIPRAPRSLQETLIAAGIAPRVRNRRGLLWRWFAAETTTLAAGNTAASVVLLLLAMTMTAFGMQIALALNAAATIYVVLNDGLPYLGVALLASAALKAVHAYFARSASSPSRIVGFALAALLFAAGLWLEVMLGYADFVPWMFKPILSLAGGEATTRIAAIDAALVSYFEPALAIALALLLAVKQTKTALVRRAPLVRKRIALAGIVASLCAIAIGLHAGYRHFTGADRLDGMSFVIGGDALSDRDRTYGSLFAPGVLCHVSSGFGWRDDPLDRSRIENHQGVDLAVKAGTPVHAMADGKVLSAELDAGLGNFVALQVRGRDGAPTIVNGHMERLLVRAGDAVQRGDVIGLAGSTGRSTGPHVHLQLCPAGHMHRGGFSCGGATNPYENWPTLAALARMSCVDGPEVF